MEMLSYRSSLSESDMKVFVAETRGKSTLDAFSLKEGDSRSRRRWDVLPIRGSGLLALSPVRPDFCCFKPPAQQTPAAAFNT